MPVRKLKPSYIANTGRYPSIKRGSSAQYESSLERNFIAMLGDDPSVRLIEEHPFSIQWLDPLGIERTYTPDMLVYSDRNVLPVVFEVKSRQEIRSNFDFLKYKYRVVKKIIRSKGFRFRVITESKLTGPYVENLLFLRKYRLVDCDEEFLFDIKKFLKSGPRSVDEFLDYHGLTVEQQIDLLPMIWASIAKKILYVDLNQKLTNATLLYHPNWEGKV